ncbi:amidase [Saxibacter everestensis]|uniref:Amidase n=1 Tax=Saxibacter everestensis TaxID=2909229 RepID=A0ABY8QS64_9MICO|nr:amidase [Brevibacteriaceae bacterium ZFBP1038]
MDETLFFESAAGIAARIRRGELSSSEFTLALIDRIRESQLNAYCTVAASAVDAARRADSVVAAGEETTKFPLLGVPVSVKDNIETAGIRTSYGSRVFAEYVPDSDAVCVRRLKAAGAVIIGKTALPEFATKGVVDSPLLGITRNPWDLTKVVGGSSGGAAAAVAAGLGPLAVGNDQAGSIRMPAALCGVAGLKPTGGRIPFAPNLFPWDQLFHVGLISRTVDDLELGLGVLEGLDPDDPLSVPAVDLPLRHAGRLSVAWSSSIGFATIEPEVLSIVREALTDIGSTADVEEVGIDLSPAALAYSILVPFKRAIETGNRLDEWADRMDPEVVDYIRLGQKMGVDDVRTGLRARSAVYVETERVLGEYDFIVTPTLSVPAFEIGLTGPSVIDGVPTTSFRDWFPYTYPFNLSGHPAVSVPAGFTADGLPVGIQIVGKRFSDRAVLALARVIEAARPWASTRPPFR